MTGKGPGAIATIGLAGTGARDLLAQIFTPMSRQEPLFQPGRVLLGTIGGAAGTIDHVTIGCEGPEKFAIHCHGNPLIVEMITELLARRGAKLVCPEELLTRILTTGESPTTIAIEGRLALLDAKTVAGARMIADQLRSGLAEKARYWLRNLDSIAPAGLAHQARRILRNSRAARAIIHGCTIALAGPPNSGKSTLFNRLAAREKAIVTDTQGTTRDWVWHQCPLGPVLATVIDTAGLGDTPADAPSIDHAAQQSSARILARAELVLLVLDASRTAEQLSPRLLDTLGRKSLVTVLNKSDLGRNLDPVALPADLGQALPISAKLGTGIDRLKQALLEATGATELDPRSPVAFTQRQRGLLERLAAARTSSQIRPIVLELLAGPVSV